MKSNSSFSKEFKLALFALLMLFIGWVIFLVLKFGIKQGLIDGVCSLIFGLSGLPSFGSHLRCTTDFQGYMSIFFNTMLIVVVVCLFYKYIWPRKNPFDQL